MKEETIKEKETLSNAEQPLEQKDTSSPDVIGDLLNERDAMSPKKPANKSEGAQEDSPPMDEKESREKASSLREEKEEETSPEVEEKDSEMVQLKNELEKTRKTLLENQRFGRQSSQKIKAALKSVQSLIESGDLSEEEAGGILSVLQSDAIDAEEMPLPASQHPFASLLQLANKELDHIRKYTEDDLLQDKIEAFDFLLSVSSKEEAEDILETLSELEDDPVKLTRKMLALGLEAYEKSYKQIKQAGGIKSYLAVQNNEIEKLQKKIDKLEKKLSQYEDYDKPSYRIPGMSDINEKSSSRDPIGSLFEERDRPRHVNR